jgi:hypothetical protein
MDLLRLVRPMRLPGSCPQGTGAPPTVFGTSFAARARRAAETVRLVDRARSKDFVWSPTGALGLTNLTQTQEVPVSNFVPPGGYPRLPDGRTVIPTLEAAHRLRVAPPYLPKLAEKHGLQRFAGRTSAGSIQYWWVEDEISDLRDKRLGIVPVVGEDEIVPFPFVGQQNEG